MFGLILKDLYTIRLYAKQLLVLFVFFILISMGLDHAALFIGSMFAMLFMMMSIYTFSYDAMCKWDRYAQTMPVSKRNIVTSKYMFSLFLNITGILFSFLISLIMLQWKPMEDFTLKYLLLTDGFLFCIMVLFSSILLPFVFRFGVEKARLIIIAIFAIPSAGFVILSRIGVQLDDLNTLFFIAKLLPFFTLVVLLLSYSLSVHIYSRKEI